MKFETYRYENGAVKLEFSFQVGNNLPEKKVFAELLEKAAEDLRNEIKSKE